MHHTNTDLIHRLSSAGLEPPKVVTLAVTHQCNLRCRHCWPNSGPELQTPAVPKKQVMRLISGFAGMGAEKFVITGGEPLLHPDWFDLLAHACSQPGVDQVRLQTNATQITPEQVEGMVSLKDRGLIIQTSLEGATSEVHDRVRGRGSFHLTLQGLKRLLESGMARHICITFTEMHHNFEQIPRVLEMVDGMGIGEFVTGTLVCAGRAENSEDLAPPIPRQYEALLARYRKDKSFRDRYRRIGNIAALEWHKENSDPSDSCCAFLETPYVSPEGNLYPCVMLHAGIFAAPHAYTRSIEASITEKIEAWSQLQRLKQSRVTDITQCRECTYYARCGAGCMGRAYSTYGDFMAVEDRCPHRKAIYRQQSDAH